MHCPYEQPRLYHVSTCSSAFASLSHRRSLFAADDGHEIGRLEWREDVLQESGADYLVIQVSLGAEQPQLSC